LKQTRFLQKSKYIREIKPTGSDIQIGKKNDFKKYGDILVNINLKSEHFETRCDILTRDNKVTSLKKTSCQPTIFIGTHNIGKEHKFELAFVGYVLGKIEGQIPEKGTIVNADGKSHGLKLKPLLKSLQKIISPLQEWLSFPANQPPPIILNKHCSLCEYKTQCRQIATEKDELTLLSGLTEKERKRQNNKGIFTVTQLSYTFRARRKPKRLASKPEKYSHALRALAIRDHKIYIAGKPKLNIKGKLVFLDIEGNPELDFYYLIGLRIMNENSYVQHSFWANEKADEKNIWILFLGILAKIDNPQLIYYGHYEKVFLKKLKERYAKTSNDILLVDQLSAESINLLSVIYSQIYFPTYSNGLKDIAQYLGFQWSDARASGLNALTRRAQWESSKNPELKQKLITYNAEDCEALEKVVNVVTQLCQEQTEESNSPDNNVIYTDSLKRESPYRLKKNKFLLPELEYINQSAYWDYQRDKIYIRSSQRLKQVSRKAIKKRSRPFPVNKIVECEPPTCCPKCGSVDIHMHAKQSKTVYDLKFNPTGIKRWTIKFCFNRYRCFKCRIVFSPKSDKWTRSKYGSNLIAYMTPLQKG
jgi:predicted RecB family nuclease